MGLTDSPSIYDIEQRTPMGQWQSVDIQFKAPFTDTIVPHQLNTASVHFIVGDRTGAGTVFRGSKAFTNQYAVLQASVAGTYHVVFYLEILGVQTPLNVSPTVSTQANPNIRWNPSGWFEQDTSVAQDGSGPWVKLTVDKNVTTTTITTTGTINDLDFGNADVIYFNNASLTTLNGLKAGVDGQMVEIVSENAQVNFPHQNVGSAAANRLTNTVTSAATPILKGVARYRYDLANTTWRLVYHRQGQWIAPTFSAGDFTASAGTWTVAGANYTAAWLLEGQAVRYEAQILATAVSSTPVQLRISNNQWGGFTSVAGQSVYSVCMANDNFTAEVTAYTIVTPSDTIIRIGRVDSAAWQVSVNQTHVFAQALVLVN